MVFIRIKEYIGKNDKILIVVKDDDRQNKLKKISQILKYFLKKCIFQNF